MTANQIQALGEKIRGVLTDDLLKPEWRDKPGRRSNTAGHCYVATEALYYAIGGRQSGFVPHSGRCPGGIHWWLEKPDGAMIDLTWDQFTKKELKEIYASGQGRGFQGLPGIPSKRAQIVLERIGERKAAHNPVGPRTESTPLFRSVSPWEMAEILRTGMIEGRSGWFSGDPRRGKMRVWFGERLNDVPHNGEDWTRYVESSEPFTTLSELATRAAEIANAIKKIKPARSYPYKPIDKLRNDAEDLAGKLREKRREEIYRVVEALAPQRDGLKATSYIIEMDFLMPGGTRYTDRDSLSLGTEVGFEEAVPYSDAQTVYLVHTRPRDLSAKTTLGWEVIDSVNPRAVSVELPKIPAKPIIVVDALVQKNEAKVRALEAKAAKLFVITEPSDVEEARREGMASEVFGS